MLDDIAACWREDGNSATFHLKRVPQDAAAAMRAAAWTELGDDCWEESFPRDSLGIAAVQRNLPRMAAPMVNQMLAPTQPWEEALEAFGRRAQESGLRWWLTGSGAAALRVPAIQPHDLDIMLDETQLTLVADVFADALVEPIMRTDGWVTRSFGVLFLGMRVDLAAGPEAFVDQPEPADFGPWAQNHLETVAWRGHLVRVPPLAVQAAVNRRRGRTERAVMIEAMLSGTS